MLGHFLLHMKTLRYLANPTPGRPLGSVVYICSPPFCLSHRQSDGNQGPAENPHVIHFILEQSAWTNLVLDIREHDLNG